MGVDGMSSDEEEKVHDGIQYRIRVPRWREPLVTPWLRMFDAIYRYHRLEENAGDMRGAMPRRRVPSNIPSTSKKFVPGLPINAYEITWLEEQLDIANVVHPGPKAKFIHDPHLAQYVLIPCCVPPSELTYMKGSTPKSQLVISIAQLYHSGLIQRMVVNVGPSPTKPMPPPLPTYYHDFSTCGRFLILFHQCALISPRPTRGGVVSGESVSHRLFFSFFFSP